MKNNWEDVINDIKSIFYEISDVDDISSELEDVLDCVCEKGKEEGEIEIRNMIANMLSEFANTPLDKRESGWEWLIKLDKKINKKIHG